MVISKNKGSLVARTSVESEGKVAYSESSQAWSVLRLKKGLVSEFPQLKEKRSKFCYRLVYYRDLEELKKAVGGIDKNEGMPMLLWLMRD